MNAWLGAFSAGVILLYCTGRVLPGHDYLFAPVLIFVILMALVLRPRFSVLFFFLLLGWAYASFRAQSVIEQRVPSTYLQQTLIASGYACSLPRRSDYYFSLDFCVHRLLDPKGLRLPYGNGRALISGKLEDLDAFRKGSLDLRIKIKPLRGSVNPVPGSYEQYLFSKGYVLRDHMVAFALPPLGEQAEESSLFKGVVEQWHQLRWNLSDVLMTHLATYEHKGLMKALALGDRSDISLDQHYILQDAGIAHLLAISGLHVGLIMLILLRFIPARGAGLLAFFVLSLAYVGLVGFSESAQRAWVMALLGLAVLKGWLDLPWHILWLYALSAVLIWNPLAPLGLGFWYSFVSAGLIIAAVHFGWLSINQPLRSALRLQLLFLAALAPFNAWFGLAHSFAFLLANLIAIPLVAWLVLPAVVMGLLSICLVGDGSWFFGFANEVLDLVLQFAESVSALFQPSHLGRNPGWLILMFLLVLAGLILGRYTWFGRLILFVSLLGIFYPNSLGRSVSERLIVFDAGQGLSILVSSGDERWVYDLGPAFGKYEHAERVVSAYLRSEGGRASIQGLMLSHGDMDHSSGYARFARKHSPEVVLSGEPERVPMVDAQPCIVGQQAQVGQLRIQVLYPFAETSADELSSNNRSCVVMIESENNKVLLMGDLEGQAEREFVRLYSEQGGDVLRADVLVAGHHGSKHATSYALLKAVEPEYVVFSAGFMNRFNHPSTEVLARVRDAGSRTLSTADSGALIFALDKDPIDISESRAEQSAFWFAR